MRAINLSMNPRAGSRSLQQNQLATFNLQLATLNEHRKGAF